ncbi:LexA family protein [Siphonobacter curvatus]|uniref:Peptidase S24/S26A/S26B/S26C domain-containing protein n=1 Tax=Siphonobacter curvatus TaxID=2094562 RepID=A0A2S7IR77_9BACT|nr:translesion error-prone DNA polymerase V autoproteolytic subunit [Siphonobacter curvatus]PQA60169.1 hypothetical protein C5O19_11280 [Siphonobacter curvatus]
MNWASVEFFHLNTQTKEFYPLSPLPIAAGFPSPADDHREGILSLSELLIEHTASTVFAWASGRSMEGAGIYDGDLLIIDRAKTPKDGDIVIAFVNGEWTVKFYKKQGKAVALVSASQYYEPILPQPDDEWQLFGVVTFTVRDHGNRLAYKRKGGL